MEEMERRLPVYLLLDCSESMVGEGIEAVQSGLRQLLLDLYSDPHAIETVWVSIIAFDSQATQIMPLTELVEVRAPKLRVRPGTALGGALKLLRECIAREVRVHSAQRKGDWKPLVFLLTDGAPTDSWHHEAKAIKAVSSSGARQLNLIAIGCGEDVDPLVLMELSDTVLMMSDRPGDFRSLFQWISSSLSISSQAIARPGVEAVSLAKIPEGLLSAPPSELGPRMQSPMPSQLFVAQRCSEYKKPYLTRYQIAAEGPYAGQFYQATRTHKVDEDYFSGQKNEVRQADEAQVSISSSQMIGVLPCPYCHNVAAGQCPGCQQVFCAPDDDRPVECPGCLRVLGFGGEGEFSLSGRMG